MKLIIQDGKDILFGDLVVAKKEELRNYRDNLLNNGYEEESHEGVTFEDVFQRGYRFDMERRAFVSRTFVDYDVLPDGNGMVTYKETNITNHYDGSISILSSLLGELETKDDGLVITKMFIDSGIYKVGNPREIWDSELKVMCGDVEAHSLDCLALEDAIRNGYLEYRVSNRVPIMYASFDSLDINGLQQIIRSSKILNGARHNKSVLRRRKNS